MAEGKICVLCGESCAGLPRIKDPQGRYYHERCHEEAKRRIAEQKAAAAEAEFDLLDTPPVPQPMPHVEDEAPIFEIVEPNEAAFVNCPGCQKALPSPAVVCTECGYNLQTGQHLQIDTKKAKGGGRAAGAAGGIAGSLLSPGGLGLLALVLFAALFAIGMSSELAAAVYMLAAGLFMFVMGIVVIVFAFLEGIVHGILSLVCGPYQLYFVFAVCENGYVKWLFGIALLAYVGAVILMVQTGAFESGAWATP